MLLRLARTIGANEYRCIMKTTFPVSVSVATRRTSHGLVTLICFLLASAGSVRGQAPNEPAKATIESVRLAVSPLTPKTAEGERNLLVVWIDSTGLSNATVRLTSPAWPEVKTKAVAELMAGGDTVELEVPPLTAATPVTVRIETPAGQRDFGPFTLQPPRKWTVYLTQHTHTDIGYTRPQTEILAGAPALHRLRAGLLRPDRQLPGRRALPLDVRDLLGGARVPRRPRRPSRSSASRNGSRKGASKSAA